MNDCSECTAAAIAYGDNEDEITCSSFLLPADTSKVHEPTGSYVYDEGSPIRQLHISKFEETRHSQPKDGSAGSFRFLYGDLGDDKSLEDFVSQTIAGKPTIDVEYFLANERGEDEYKSGHESDDFADLCSVFNDSIRVTIERRRCQIDLDIK